MTRRKTSLTRYRLPAALCAGLLLGAPILASAEDEPPPPGDFGSADHGHHGGPEAHHGGPFDGAMMQELHKLNLSDAQRDTIRGYLKAEHEQHRAEFETMHSLRRAFLTATPGSADYRTAVAQLADASADAARTHVLTMADLRTKITGVLNDAQKAQLASDLANLPEHPEHQR